MHIIIHSKFRQVFAQPISLSRLFTLVTFFVLNLTIFALSRTLLYLTQSSLPHSVNGYLSIFIDGLNIDLHTMSYLFAPAAVLLLLSKMTELRCYAQNVYRLYLIGVSCLIAGLEIMTPSLITSSHVRFVPQFITDPNLAHHPFLWILKNASLTLTVTFIALYFLSKVASEIYNATSRLDLCVSRQTRYLVYIVFIAILAQGWIGNRHHQSELMQSQTQYQLEVELSTNSTYALLAALNSSQYIRH
ncbi:hypothetical protein [Vibrio olivae]|uniref:Sulfatase n=1 Tax=Vibrio olivae TaxID=1243002 RepID=A0ABV5HSR4_9VIBR